MSWWANKLIRLLTFSVLGDELTRTLIILLFIVMVFGKL